MNVEALQSAYADGTETPEDVVESLLARIGEDDHNAWILVREASALRDRAGELADRDPAELPLYGVPFAVKDNFDVAGMPTTAGCPGYTYEPETSATVVERLREAGAILVGKTNMDQFATGLVGTRSPYGACRNAHNPEYISGGSSAGSAVAVALGQVAFALGTDTAGSGRVPAAMNGIVGLKPSRGLVSTRGVVPACASLDCVSVFARTTEGARIAGDVAAGFDADDPYSRREAAGWTFDGTVPEDLRIGVAPEAELSFFGDDDARELYGTAIDRIDGAVGTVETIDFEPFAAAAELLYQGPWVAERLAAVGDFLAESPEEVLTVTREIIERGEAYTARETFEAQHELKRLQREAEGVFEDIDVLVTPTAGTTYTIAEVADEPVELNSNLGTYTNFCNLLDLAAVSVPAGSFAAGPGFGLTVFGPALSDGTVAAVADEIATDPLTPERDG